MIGIYFSGTGNTEFCINKFMKLVDCGASIMSIENENIIVELQKHEDIIFAQWDFLVGTGQAVLQNSSSDMGQIL